MDPKILAALKKHQFHKAEILLRKVHTQSSLLFLVIEHNMLNVLQPLLEYYLKTMTKEHLNNELAQALFLKSALKNDEITDILLAFSFQHQLLNQVFGQPLLIYAASQNYTRIVYALLTWMSKDYLMKPPTHLDNQNICNALKVAIQNRGFNSAAILLKFMEKYKFNITLIDSHGHSLFMYAAQHSSHTFSRALMNIIRKDYPENQLTTMLTNPCLQGETVLEIAFKSGNKYTFSIYLLEASRLQIPFLSLVPNLKSALSIAVLLSQKEPHLYTSLLKKEFFAAIRSNFYSLMKEAIQYQDYGRVNWLLNYANSARLNQSAFSFLEFAYRTNNKEIIKLLFNDIAYSTNEKTRNQIFFKTLVETSLKGLMTPVKIILDYLVEKNFLKPMLEQYQDHPNYLKIQDYLEENACYFNPGDNDNVFLREYHLTTEYIRSTMLETRIRAWIDTLPSKITCSPFKLSFFEPSNAQKIEPQLQQEPSAIHTSKTY